MLAVQQKPTWHMPTQLEARLAAVHASFSSTQRGNWSVIESWGVTTSAKHRWCLLLVFCAQTTSDAVAPAGTLTSWSHTGSSMSFTGFPSPASSMGEVVSHGGGGGGGEGGGKGGGRGDLDAHLHTLWSGTWRLQMQPWYLAGSMVAQVLESVTPVASMW